MFFVPPFVRSGRLYLPGVNGNTYRDVGQWGRDWSSRGTSIDANNSTVLSAYYLDYGPSEAFPSRGPWGRWHGFSLRCLSTVLGM